MIKGIVFITSLVLGLGLSIEAAAQDIPLKVTIEGNMNVPGGYRIVSDGREYVDGVEGVYARFQVINGTNDFIMDPTDRPVRVPRAIWFDFTNQVAAGAVSNPWDGKGLTKIDTYVNINDVFSTPVNPDPNAYELKYGGFGQLFSGGKKINWRVAFQVRPDSPNYLAVNNPNPTAFFEVRHPDCNTWIITPQSVHYDGGSGSGTVSALINSTNGESAGQYLMPVKIILTRRIPVTCP